MIVKLLKYNKETYDFDALLDGKKCKVDPFVSFCDGFACYNEDEECRHNTLVELALKAEGKEYYCSEIGEDSTNCYFPYDFDFEELGKREKRLQEEQETFDKYIGGNGNGK